MRQGSRFCKWANTKTLLLEEQANHVYSTVFALLAVERHRQGQLFAAWEVALSSTKAFASDAEQTLLLSARRAHRDSTSELGTVFVRRQSGVSSSEGQEGSGTSSTDVRRKFVYFRKVNLFDTRKCAFENAESAESAPLS